MPLPRGGEWLSALNENDSHYRHRDEGGSANDERRVLDANRIEDNHRHEGHEEAAKPGRKPGSAHFSSLTVMVALVMKAAAPKAATLNHHSTRSNKVGLK